jgi:hypothetical protein
MDTGLLLYDVKRLYQMKSLILVLNGLLVERFIINFFLDKINFIREIIWVTNVIITKFLA